MTRHKRDLDLNRCQELHKKIQEYKTKLDAAYQDFEAGIITAEAAKNAAENYQYALIEYTQHCGEKLIS
jgi:hypothetical protein